MARAGVRVGAETELLHATAIALNADAVLICGPSGAGKSDLALRCLAQPASPLWGGSVTLVSDDQVALARVGNVLRASAPPAIRGKMEIRGLGILQFAETEAVIRLIADLVPPEHVERLPEISLRRLLGVDLPVVKIAPFTASAPAKLLLALSRHAGLYPAR